MTKFNQDLDQTLRVIFWRANDLGIIAALLIAASIYFLWVMIERQNFTPHHRLMAYLVSLTFLGDIAAILWSWGMGWQWTVMAGLIPPLVVMLYFMPTAAAIYWQHPSPNSIFAINLLTGWTLVGWALAFM
jgi:T4 superinfection immunity protein